MTDGADLIAAERQCQIDAEGWTTKHDAAAHDSGELVYAAISYAYSPFSDVRQAPDDDYRKPPGTAAPSTWPWEDEWWKPTPKDRVRELTKAGALIAAEIDRLQRIESPGLSLGDHVRHYMSGWTGVVAAVSVDEHMGQGRLVTVDPVYAGGKTWKPITVTEAELEVESNG